jgi:hypothetical protein
MRAVRSNAADMRSWGIRCHLLCCRKCRLRVKTAEAELLRLYASYERNELKLDARLPSAEASLGRLLENMQASASQTMPKDGSAMPFSRSIAVASACAITAAVCIAILLPRHERKTTLTADAVLDNAVAVEPVPSVHQQPGVIFERVNLRVHGEQFEWPVYRDRQGVRKARFQPVSAREATLRHKLENAGVLREDPLSAASFRNWRDRLHTHTDRIAASSAGNITITTSVEANSSSDVREETLTLREKDYHPLARTVEFRDAEVVEIAEVDYRVLNWNQVESGWFETSEAHPVMHAAVPEPPPAPVVPAALTEEQLDLAELQAQLALSRQDASGSEQIELSRKPDGIVVHGIVSTSERKEKIQTVLTAIPHVSAQLFTPAEMDAAAANTATEPAATPHASIQLIQSSSLPSPLLLYWKNRQKSLDQLPGITQQLLNSGLRIRQQSHAMLDISRRYADRNVLTPESREVWDALWADHVEKLRASLEDQSRLLSLIAPSQPISPQTESTIDTTDASDLEKMASKSFALCQELTAGKDPQRDAAVILSELKETSSMLSAALRHLPSHSR